MAGSGSRRWLTAIVVLALVLTGCVFGRAEPSAELPVESARSGLLSIVEPTAFDEGLNPLFSADTCALWRGAAAHAWMQGSEHSLMCFLALDPDLPPDDLSAMIVAHLIDSPDQLRFGDLMTREGRWRTDPARPLAVEGAELDHECHTRLDSATTSVLTPTPTRDRLCIATFRSGDLEISIVGVQVEDPESASSLLETNLVWILDQLAAFELGDYLDLSIYGDCYSVVETDC